jgi:hypothetical protein
LGRTGTDEDGDNVSECGLGNAFLPKVKIAPVAGTPASVDIVGLVV